MQTLLVFIRVEVVVGLACGLAMLYFQLRAYRRHGKSFFLTLVNSTIFALLASGLASCQYFVAMREEVALTAVWLSVPLYVLATLLGTWGGIQFFRAYDAK